MIIDKATIYIRSGKGGEPSSAVKNLSSRKTMGNGGDGGKGGDVVLAVSPHLYDLNKFKGNKKFIASSGERGAGGNKKGKDAKSLSVNLPEGTRVFEEEELLVDLAGQTNQFLVCKGGKGGKGSYKQDYTLPPEEGEEKYLTLDYRIPNDIAILGFANSGKTSLFNALTGQNSKVADYPFTTASCFWASGEHEFKLFKALDTPPLRKSKDLKNLAENSFLRHIFRSKILLLLSENVTSAAQDFKAMEREISLFDKLLLSNKKIFYLLSKVDTIDKKKGKILKVSSNNPESIRLIKEKIINNLK